MIDSRKYTWLRIEPVDAWFFRDGRPSNRGEDQSDLESEFPPNAATVVGAIRAALARSQGWNGRGSWRDQLTANDNDVLGDGFDDLGKLSFLGPLLMQTNERQTNELLFPMPQHVVGHAVKGRFQPVALLKPSSEPVLTDCGEISLPVLPDDWRDRLAKQPSLSDAQRKKPPEPAGDLYVTSAGMSKILRGEVPAADDCRRRSDLFEHESRVGIRRDEDTRTTGQGDIYSPRYVRLNDKERVSLVMAVAGVPDDWTLPSLMPLGGESRLAGVEVLKDAPSMPRVSASSGPATVISVTPTRVRGSWWGAGPDDDAASLGGGLSGRVTTLALDRPRLIGGWDTRKSQALPLAPFAPAGTVWWLENSQACDTGLIQLGDSLQTKYGYGLAFRTGST